MRTPAAAVYISLREVGGWVEGWGGSGAVLRASWTEHSEGGASAGALSFETCISHSGGRGGG